MRSEDSKLPAILLNSLMIFRFGNKKK